MERDAEVQEDQPEGDVDEVLPPVERLHGAEQPGPVDPGGDHALSHSAHPLDGMVQLFLGVNLAAIELTLDPPFAQDQHAVADGE